MREQLETGFAGLTRSQRRVISLLRDHGDMAIVLVKQCYDFARELAQRIIVMDRGDIVLAGRQEELDETNVRARLSV
jgi:urea transport system ATP-binding protein